jgi:hypothetical protein
VRYPVTSSVVGSPPGTALRHATSSHPLPRGDAAAVGDVLLVAGRGADVLDELLGHDPQGGAVADHHDRAALRVPFAQLGDDGHVAGEQVAPALPAGVRGVEVAVQPAVDDAAERRDRGPVVAALELADLHLVHPGDLGRRDLEVPGDQVRGLVGPPGRRVVQRGDRALGAAGELASQGRGLQTPEIGERGPGQHGVEDAVDVGLRLAVAGEDEAQVAHAPVPSRSAVSHEAASV